MKWRFEYSLAAIILSLIGCFILQVNSYFKIKKAYNNYQEQKYNIVDDLDMKYLVVNISYYTDTHDRVTLRCLLDSDTHTMGDLVETTVSRNNLHIGDTIKMCY